MRHPPVLALLLALSCIAAIPRTSQAQSVELGLRAGLHRATVAWDPTPLGDGLEGVETRYTVTGGGHMSVALPGGFRLAAELLRTSRGFRQVQTNGDETLLDVTYLELPVLLSRRFRTVGPVRPELFVGPALAWETGCRVDGSVQGQEVSFDCDEVPDGAVERRTRVWDAVAGLSLHLGNAAGPHVVWDVRYVLGLTNVDGAPEIDNLNLRHRGASASVGLVLPLGDGSS